MVFFFFFFFFFSEPLPTYSQIFQRMFLYNNFIIITYIQFPSSVDNIDTLIIIIIIIITILTINPNYHRATTILSFLNKHF